MVVDSSALAAVLFLESDADHYALALAQADRALMSAVNLLEIAIVAEARKGEAGRSALVDLLAEARVETIAFDAGQAEVALDAWRRFGKGQHEARFNMGDCAAYALARTTNQPLLFKGCNFCRTDISQALVTEN